MYALAHASFVARKWLEKKDHGVTYINFSSDCQSALQSIFNPSPHPAQAASIFFQDNLLNIFNKFTCLKGRAHWTPGHGGVPQMKVTDALAKKACKPRCHPQCRFLLKFMSRSAALTLLERKTKTRWRKIKDDTEIGKRSGSYKTFPYLELRLRPPPWFKSISRPIMSRLTQFTSNHGYIGEYFHGFNIEKDSYKCPCLSNPPRFQTCSHII